MAGTGSRSAVVGRELDLDRLNRRLEAAAEGRGGVVVLRGPSGLGATRTAHEVAGRADRLGLGARRSMDSADGPTARSVRRSRSWALARPAAVCVRILPAAHRHWLVCVLAC